MPNPTPSLHVADAPCHPASPVITNPEELMRKEIIPDTQQLMAEVIKAGTAAYAVIHNLHVALQEGAESYLDQKIQVGGASGPIGNLYTLAAKLCGFIVLRTANSEFAPVLTPKAGAAAKKTVDAVLAAAIVGDFDDAYAIILRDATVDADSIEVDAPAYNSAEPIVEESAGASERDVSGTGNSASTPTEETA